MSEQPTTSRAPAASLRNKRRYCAGCDNDFYNGHNELGVRQCWHLASARVVWRWRIGWWTQPARGAYRRVRTLTCHSAPGRYAQVETIDREFVPLRRRKKEEHNA